MKSALESLFELHLKASKIKHEREYKFHVTRKWRFDFAIVDKKIAIEVQGGIWNGGKHGRGIGIQKDYEKLNAAMELGWQVYQFSGNMIKSGEAIRQIERVVNV